LEMFNGIIENQTQDRNSTLMTYQEMLKKQTIKISEDQEIQKKQTIKISEDQEILKKISEDQELLKKQNTKIYEEIQKNYEELEKMKLQILKKLEDQDNKIAMMANDFKQILDVSQSLVKEIKELNTSNLIREIVSEDPNKYPPNSTNNTVPIFLFQNFSAWNNCLRDLNKLGAENHIKFQEVTEVDKYPMVFLAICLVTLRSITKDEIETVLLSLKKRTKGDVAALLFRYGTKNVTPYPNKLNGSSISKKDVVFELHFDDNGLVENFQNSETIIEITKLLKPANKVFGFF